MQRRTFLGASLAVVGSIFVPQFEGWYRQGSGLLVPDPSRSTLPGWRCVAGGTPGLWLRTDTVYPCISFIPELFITERS